MATKILSLLASLFLATAVIAQGPPELDTQAWQVVIPPPPGTAGPPAPLPYLFKPEYLFSIGGMEVFEAKLVDDDGDPVEDVNGNPIYCEIYDPNPLDGTVLEVFNSDSGQWTTWTWNGTFYEKSGGTKHARGYMPLY